MGEILQNTTGKNFTELANSFVKRLKMKKTFVYNHQNNQALVPGYRSENNQFEKVEHSFLNDEIAPAAGVISTVEDLQNGSGAL